MMDKEPARVRVGIKYVRNLGNFESAHVDIGVEDSVRGGENVTQAFDRIYAFVEKRIEEKITEIDEDLRDRDG